MVIQVPILTTSRTEPSGLCFFMHKMEVSYCVWEDYINDECRVSSTVSAMLYVPGGTAQGWSI